MKKFDVSDEELRKMYLAGKSSYVLCREYNVSNKLILNRLHALPDWPELKQQILSIRFSQRNAEKLFEGVCERCGKNFTRSRKSRFCNVTCQKGLWNKQFRNKTEINLKRREKRKQIRANKVNDKILFEQDILLIVKKVHKRNIDKIVKKLSTRAMSAKNSIVVRSNKKQVECNITVNDIRELILKNYGNPCKYCNKILTHKNLTFDHIVPISHKGTSNRDNFQVICKTCNNIKGSLQEVQFLSLLQWLSTLEPDMAKDIKIRLAHGIH